MEQTRVIDFSRFHSRLRIPGRLKLETPLRIGAGGLPGATEVDLPVIKDQAQRPFIPGSSFKGALRAHLEAILRAFDFELACMTLTDDARCITQARIDELKRQYADDSDGLSQALIQASCWTCRVFGAPWLASKVLFKDMPVVDTTWFGRYQERSGVGIDRDTETASEGLLYSAEAVPSGVEFEFEMSVENADEMEQGLILLGIMEVERGQVAMGGARSRGLGWVTLQVNWDKAYRIDQASLRRYLATGQGEPLADEALRRNLVEDFLGHVGSKHA